MRYILFVGVGDGNELSEGWLGVARVSGVVCVVIVTDVTAKCERDRFTVTGVTEVTGVVVKLVLGSLEERCWSSCFASDTTFTFCYSY